MNGAGADCGGDAGSVSNSTKTLDDLREEVSFHVGWVKNTRFLFPAKKAVDACWAARAW